MKVLTLSIIVSLIKVPLIKYKSILATRIDHIIVLIVVLGIIANQTILRYCILHVTKMQQIRQHSLGVNHCTADP